MKQYPYMFSPQRRKTLLMLIVLATLSVNTVDAYVFTDHLTGPDININLSTATTTFSLIYEVTLEQTRVIEVETTFPQSEGFTFSSAQVSKGVAVYGYTNTYSASSSNYRIYTDPLEPGAYTVEIIYNTPPAPEGTYKFEGFFGSKKNGYYEEIAGWCSYISFTDPSYGFTWVDPPATSVLYGASKTVPIQVTNIGNTQDTYSAYDDLGNPKGTTSLVQPGETVTINFPIKNNLSPGFISYNAKIKSNGDPSWYRYVEVCYHIYGYEEYGGPAAYGAAYIGDNPYQRDYYVYNYDFYS